MADQLFSLVRGDSQQIVIALTHGASAYTPPAGSTQTFTLKRLTADEDSSAMVQKTIGAGLTIAGTNATAVFVPQDTYDLQPSTPYLFDVQSQESDGKLKTVAFGSITFRGDITRQPDTSITIFTTQPTAYQSAATSAAAAAASAVAAAGSASTATTQAGIATTKAGEASGSASAASASAITATTQAGIATTKASEASASASSASGSASTATTQAGNAATSASAASGSASSASSSASAASDSADDAAASAVAAAASVGVSLLKASNLSDLTNASTARTNLGLGSLFDGTGGYTAQSARLNGGEGDVFENVSSGNWETGAAITAARFIGDAGGLIGAANIDVTYATSAGDADALSTPRTINGVSFDGTANITVAAAGSTLTDTVPVGKGGTGATTLSANSVLLGNGTSALQVVAPGTAGNVLRSDGTTWTSASIQLGDRYLTSSTTSNTISNGAKTFTVGTGLAYSPTQDIIIVFDAAHHMDAEVTSYNSTTGVLVVDVNHHKGSGTYAVWTVNVGGIGAGAIPSGGTTGQVLAKVSNSEYDDAWVTPTVAVSNVTGLGTAATRNVGQAAGNVPILDMDGFLYLGSGVSSVGPGAIYLWDADNSSTSSIASSDGLYFTDAYRSAYLSEFALTSQLPTFGTGVATALANTAGAAGGFALTNNVVAGPASATDNAIARFDATTGKLVQDSGITISDVASSAMTVSAPSSTDLNLTGTGGTFQIFRAANFPFVWFPGSSSTAGRVVYSMNGATSSATSGTNIGLNLTPTYNQTSGTAANTDLLVNRTQTAVGSGTQRLLDLQVGGVSQFSVSNTGVVLASNGSSTAPAYSFASSPNSGIVVGQGGAGRLTLYAGGALGLYLDQNNNVAAFLNTTRLGWSSGTPIATGIDVAFSRLSAGVLGLGTGGAASVAGALSCNEVRLSRTITAAGTTGAQTINNSTGSVNFAAAATSLVVTNSLCTVNSVIQLTVGTNDTTMRSAIAVAAAGSFTIFASASPTTETRVNFTLTN
jgi:hypothetical protein